MFTIACHLGVGLGLRLWLGLDLVGKLLCTRICATLGCNCHAPEVNVWHYALLVVRARKYKEV